MSWSGTLTTFPDGVSWTGAANSDTTPDFTVLGGKYALGNYSSGTASATLNVKIGTNYIACGSAVTTYNTFDLPPGTYQIVFGASAGTDAGFLIRVPYRAA